MTDKSIDLEQLIALSGTILEKAREDNWDEVTSLEAERSELLELFFAEPVQPEAAKVVGEGIQTILAIDQEIMALGNLVKLDLAESLHKLEQGKKAVKAYSS